MRPSCSGMAPHLEAEGVIVTVQVGGCSGHRGIVVNGPQLRCRCSSAMHLSSASTGQPGTSHALPG